MAKIKYFLSRQISIYIYGEKNEKHHNKHVLVLKKDEDCQYGFDGKPIPGTKGLKNKIDSNLVENWILSHQEELEKAWDDINNGINPGLIE